jgi:hypothetical protein
MVRQKKQKPGPPRMPSAPAAPKPITVKQQETRSACAELDRICAARPLKPPPLPNHHDMRSAGAVALAAEIREGTYEP